MTNKSSNFACLFLLFFVFLNVIPVYAQDEEEVMTHHLKPYIGFLLDGGGDYTALNGGVRYLKDLGNFSLGGQFRIANYYDVEPGFDHSGFHWGLTTCYNLYGALATYRFGLIGNWVNHSFKPISNFSTDEEFNHKNFGLGPFVEAAVIMSRYASFIFQLGYISENGDSQQGYIDFNAGLGISF